MASRNDSNRHVFLVGSTWTLATLGLFGMAGYAEPAYAQLTAPPAMMPAATPGPVVIDARRSLPLFPANSWRDGFYLEHSAIGDFGLHIRGTGIYGRSPLGRDADLNTIGNRFTIHGAALVSLANWVQLGVAIPFVLYQDATGFDLTTTAVGDLRALAKINFHLPEKLPQIAASVGLGFQTASSGSANGAGGISGYPRLIIDMPKLFDKRLHIAANLGAVIAGTTRPCTPEEAAEKQKLAEQQAMMMMGMPSTTGMTGPVCEERTLGLGNHLIWGVGVSGLLSPDNGFYLTTELLGSVSVGSSVETNTPLFWTAGFRRSKANATYFSAAYGYGITDASPGHTVYVAIGLVWENTPPKKEKKEDKTPTIKIDLNLSGLPQGASATVGGKDGAKASVKPGKPAEGGGDAPKPAEGGEGGGGGEAKPAKSAGPAKQAAPVSTSIDVSVPEGLVPAEASKDKDKGGGKGDKK